MITAIRTALLSVLVIVFALGRAHAQAPAAPQPAAPPPDTDYDGRTDAQELADGTDPRDPASVKPVRLGYWRFNTNNGANPWLGENGAAPLYSIAVQSAPSFDGGALQITNAVALLAYRDVETNGAANINCRLGSIRLMFKPLWTSARAGGTGPGQLARLLELGQPKSSPPFSGTYSFSFDAKGDMLWFGVQDSSTNQLSYGGNVSLRSNQWYQIVLSVSSTNLRMWVDGQMVAYLGQSPKFLPPPEARIKGFAIGGDLNNTNQAKGLIDELETFNYPLGAADVFAIQGALSATVSAAPPAITLHWRGPPTNVWTIQRRGEGQTNWSALSSGSTAWSFTDTNVAVGTRYEYLVGDRYLLSSINGPLVTDRGRVLLLVDKTIAAPLAKELAQLKTNLIGDGWTVARLEVDRHNDNDWSANAARIAQIKAHIAQEYQAAPTALKAVFLIGHVPIPYSGLLSPDGHGFRAFPADGYYGDVDGQWTDAQNYRVSDEFTEARHKNLAGDGKWDQLGFPPNAQGLAHLEVAVGRVDFANLPIFLRAPFLGAPRTPHDTEVALLRQYLTKDHRYRHKLFALPERFIVTDTTGAGACHIYCSALASAGRCFGWEPGTMLEGDLFATTNAFLWGFQFGRSSGVAISDGLHTVNEFADPAKGSRVAFALLDGSYFGDFDSTNNFLRAFLGGPHYSLAAMWKRTLFWRFERLALGEHLGTAMLRAINEAPRTGSFYDYNIFIDILGDPTLRLFILSPPANLRADRQGGDVLLRWGASPEPGARYLVLRSTAGLDGAFTTLTPVPASDTTFTDTNAPAGPKLYQVRALALVTSASGSFTNSSQGVFVAVP
ncbi:MAG: LamG domain-containing protein [Verrucomicrobia bacterium]|nr:LamG domain-containing protein [Verrucomicrobiota bacterium]